MPLYADDTCRSVSSPLNLPMNRGSDKVFQLLGKDLRAVEVFLQCKTVHPDEILQDFSEKKLF